MRLPSKDPAEIKLVRFLFSDELERGVTLVNATRAIAVTKGADAGAAAVFDGVALIDAATNDVLQRVTLGLHDCDYELRMLATDSSGLKHLIVATLPVRNGT